MYSKLESEKGVEAAQVEVLTATTTAAPPSPPTKRGFFFLSKFLCCLEVSTGVKVYGLLDTLAGVVTFLASFLVLWARTHEHAFDKALEPVLIQANTTDVEGTIHEINHRLNEASVSVVPLLFLTSLIFMWLGATAFKMDVDSARKYYAWKLGYFLVSFFFGGFCHFLFNFYAAVICRSHWLLLQEEKTAVASLPVTVVVVGTRQQHQADDAEDNKPTEVVVVDDHHQQEEEEQQPQEEPTAVENTQGEGLEAPLIVVPVPPSSSDK